MAGGALGEGAENASPQLATVDGFDAILTGHHHRVFPGPTYEGIEGADLERATLLGVPAAMPGFWGSHLGILDLTLARDGGAWHVAGAAVKNRPIYERDKDNRVVPLAESDERIVAAVAARHQETLDYVRRAVGETAAPITSCFALVADDPSVQIDPQAERIRDLRFDGAPIDPAQMFVVATNNYRASGGGSLPGIDGSNVILEAPDTNRDVIVRYIVAEGTINPSADDNWRLAPTTGSARLIFETGPGAAPHAQTRGDIRPIDTAPSGFARYELTLGS